MVRERAWLYVVAFLVVIAALVWTAIARAPRSFRDETATRLPAESNHGVRADAGDVDGDRDVDFIVANGPHSGDFDEPSQDAILYINNGAGIFVNEAASRLPPSAFGMQVASGAFFADIDGDTDLDTFVTNGGRSFPQSFGGCQNLLWINNGSGVFADETTTRLPAVTDSSFDAAFGDIDGDGDLDIVVGNIGELGTGEQNRLLINDGAGVFADETTARLPALDDITIAVALADVDGDSDLDTVTVSGSGQGLRILINSDGTGNFRDETNERVGMVFGSADVKTTDLNGDDAAEILFSQAGGPFDPQGRPRLLVNSGSGVFTEETETRIPETIPYSHGLALADVDDDEDVDVFVTVPGDQHRLLLNNGTGSFTDATDAMLPALDGIVRYATFGDVDNDGDADLYVPLWGELPTQRQDRLLINKKILKVFGYEFEF